MLLNSELSKGAGASAAVCITMATPARTMRASFILI
jgi:hypothetical protein